MGDTFPLGHRTGFVQLEPIDPPVLSVGAVASGVVTLNWTPVDFAQAYGVNVGTAAGQESFSRQVTGTTTTISGLIDGTEYFFTVQSFGSAGQGYGEASNEVNATPMLPAPTNLVATPGDGQVSLTWDTVTGACFYDVFVATYTGGEAPPATMRVSDASAIVTDLTDGQPYFFTVEAVPCGGGANSAMSAEATATPQAACTPLSSDVCYLAGNEPQTEEDDVSGSVTYAIDWSDDTVCGYNINGALDASLNITIEHINIPMNQQKSRQITVFPQWSAAVQGVVITSNPTSAGDAMPDFPTPGTWPASNGAYITWTTDCSGNLTAAVVYNNS